MHSVFVIADQSLVCHISAYLPPKSTICGILRSVPIMGKIHLHKSIFT